MNLSLFAKSKKNFNKGELKEICNLKNSFWKYGIKSQIKWFRENVKNKDINVLLKKDHKIIGYALLRHRSLQLSKKKSKYLLFDTLIVAKAQRRNNFARLMVNFVNITIKRENRIGVLYCVSGLIKYYLSMGWDKLNKNRVRLIDHNLDQQPLIYNAGNNLRKLKSMKIDLFSKS